MSTALSRCRQTYLGRNIYRDVKIKIREKFLKALENVFLKKEYILPPSLLEIRLNNGIIQTGRQTDRQTDRQIDRQTDRQTDRLN
jgi:hypothetical protein